MHFPPTNFNFRTVLSPGIFLEPFAYCLFGAIIVKTHLKVAIMQYTALKTVIGCITEKVFHIKNNCFRMVTL